MVNDEERIHYDIEKMININNQWNNLAEYDIEKMYNNLMDNYYDKFIHLIPYSKTEWFNISDNERTNCKVINQLINRSDFPSIANKKQQECNYKISKF